MDYNNFIEELLKKPVCMMTGEEYLELTHFALANAQNAASYPSQGGMLSLRLNMAAGCLDYRLKVLRSQLPLYPHHRAVRRAQLHAQRGPRDRFPPGRSASLGGRERGHRNEVPAGGQLEELASASRTFRLLPGIGRLAVEEPPSGDAELLKPGLVGHPVLLAVMHYLCNFFFAHHNLQKF